MTTGFVQAVTGWRRVGLDGKSCSKGTVCRRGAVKAVAAVKNEAFLDSVFKVRDESSDGVAGIRKLGEDALLSQKAPGLKSEDWRFTGINSLYEKSFSPVSGAQVEVSEELRSEHAAVSLLFVDGKFVESGSRMGDLDGEIKMGSIESLSSEDASKAKDLAMSSATGADQGGYFALLNAACLQDVFVISIPDNVTVDKPIQLIFSSSPAGDQTSFTASHPRIVIMTGRNTSVTFVEHHAANCLCFTNLCASVFVGDGSKVSYAVINESTSKDYQISTVAADVGRDATYELLSVGVGGKFSRVDGTVIMANSGAHGEVKGMALGLDDSVIDLTSRIRHDAPNCTSNQLQKNIATDKARTIFRGRIKVTGKGTGTDSNQLCRSLLLSKKAIVDAMPVLEIDTEDVKCSHGATVADLEEEQIFYCTSRGLSVDESRFLLIRSFVEEIVRVIPLSDVRQRILGRARQIPGTVLDDGEKIGFFSSV